MSACSCSGGGQVTSSLNRSPGANEVGSQADRAVALAHQLDGDVAALDCNDARADDARLTARGWSASDDSANTAARPRRTPTACARPAGKAARRDGGTRRQWRRRRLRPGGDRGQRRQIARSASAAMRSAAARQRAQVER